MAFDSGGVTTGPMTVPFIMALGLGVSSTRSDEQGRRGQLRPGGAVLRRADSGGSDSGADLSGLRSLCARYGAGGRQTAGNCGSYLPGGFPIYAKEVAIALAPIAAFFAMFQMVSLHLPRKNVLKITGGHSCILMWGWSCS